VKSVMSILMCLCFSKIFEFTCQVYLEDRKEAQVRHQQSLKMLSEEVSQIQEVRAKIFSVISHFSMFGCFKNMCFNIVVLFAGEILSKEPQRADGS